MYQEFLLRWKNERTHSKSMEFLQGAARGASPCSRLGIFGARAAEAVDTFAFGTRRGRRRSGHVRRARGPGRCRRWRRRPVARSTRCAAPQLWRQLVSLAKFVNHHRLPRKRDTWPWDPMRSEGCTHGDLYGCWMLKCLGLGSSGTFWTGDLLGHRCFIGAGQTNILSEMVHGFCTCTYHGWASANVLHFQWTSASSDDVFSWVFSSWAQIWRQPFCTPESLGAQLCKDSNVNLATHKQNLSLKFQPDCFNLLVWQDSSSRKSASSLRFLSFTLWSLSARAFNIASSSV